MRWPVSQAFHKLATVIARGFSSASASIGNTLDRLGMRHGRRSQAFAAAFLLAPVLVLLGVFFVYPLIAVIVQSFSNPSHGFENYIQLYKFEVFRKVFEITFTIALETTIVCLLLGLPFAHYLTTISKKRASIYLLLSLTPFWVTTIVRLYAWTIILGREGLINTVLMDAHIIHQPLSLLYSAALWWSGCRT